MLHALQTGEGKQHTQGKEFLLETMNSYTPLRNILLTCLGEDEPISKTGKESLLLSEEED
jgi:hypothetical protein